MRYNSSFLILTLDSSPKYQNAVALVWGASKAEQLIWFSSFLRLLLFIILQCQGPMGAGTLLLRVPRRTLSLQGI